MFDQMKMMGAVASLMKDKERLREVGEQFRERVERLRVEGESGGGAVRVTVTGRLRVEGVFLDPALIAGLGTGEGGRAMAQSLIEEATNDGLTRVQALIKEEAQRSARELGLPEIPGIERMLTQG